MLNESTIRARRQTMVGRIGIALKKLHDKAPEAHEEILKLTKIICGLAYLTDDTEICSEKINRLYEHITAKF